MFSLHTGKAPLNHFPSTEVAGDVIVYRLLVIILQTNLTFSLLKIHWGGFWVSATANILAVLSSAFSSKRQDAFHTAHN